MKIVRYEKYYSGHTPMCQVVINMEESQYLQFLHLLGEKFTSQNNQSKRKPTSTMETDGHGNRYWYNEYIELHRLDGPAIERADGSKFWYVNGKQHRTDGPACEYPNGNKYYFLNGIQYSYEDWKKKLNS